MPLDQFESIEEVVELVARIRACEVNNEGFMHREHLAMAAFVCLEGHKDTLGEIRKIILALNASNGVEQSETGGYHETLAVAWYRLVRFCISCCVMGKSKMSKINAVLLAFENKRMILDYYSRDLIMSWKARTEWVEPDLEPLPG